MRQSTDKKGVDQAVAILVRHGIRQVICSPGSRNAPLVLAIRSHPGLEVEVIVDERVAAFTALGKAISSGQACVLCCTSGSAVVNYYPAIVEAYYQRVPLVVLTADRPEDRIDQQEGQSIRQKDLFSEHVLSMCSIDEKELSEEALAGLSASIIQTGSIGGPVHWNMPLSEPLYGTSEQEDVGLEISSSKPNDPSFPWMELKESWSGAERVLLICGQVADREAAGERRTLLQQWAERFPQLSVWYETISNTEFEAGMSCIDRFIIPMSAKEKEGFRPDLLLSMGGEWVSRKVKKWLRSFPEVDHWHIDRYRHPDLLCRSFREIHADPLHFLQEGLEQLTPCIGVRSYSADIGELAELRSERHRQYIQNSSWSDLRLFAVLNAQLPKKAVLFNGNSSVVRYTQLFRWSSELFHLANRGVSGIDGVTSTAIGYAKRSSENVFLVTGDLAFFYDSNAFWQQDLPDNLKILVVNNGGGGIFRIIEGPDASGWFGPHFEQTHQRSAKDLANMYGLQYFCAATEEDLNNCLQDWLSSKTLAVLEVHTPREQNDIVLDNYFNYLRYGRS